MSTNQILEAYSRLGALKDNLPRSIDEKYVHEFHQVLDLLEQHSGASLGAFRIPSEQVCREVAGSVMYTGETFYTDERYCDRNYFTMKIDGVIRMFSLLLDSGERGKSPIGFSPPGT